MSQIFPIQNETTVSSDSAPAFYYDQDELSQMIGQYASLISELQNDPSLAAEPRFQSLFLTTTSDIDSFTSMLSSPNNGLTPSEIANFQSVCQAIQNDVMNAPIQGTTYTIGSFINNWKANPAEVQSMLTALSQDSSTCNMFTQICTQASSSLNQSALSSFTPSLQGVMAVSGMASYLEDAYGCLTDIQQNPNLASNPATELALAQEITSFCNGMDAMANNPNISDQEKAYIENDLGFNIEQEAIFLPIPGTNENTLYQASEDAMNGNYSTMTQVLQNLLQNPGTLNYTLQLIGNTIDRMNSYGS